MNTRLRNMILILLLTFSTGVANSMAIGEPVGLYGKKTTATTTSAGGGSPGEGYSGVYQRAGSKEGRDEYNNEGDILKLERDQPLGSGLATLVVLMALYGICKYKNSYRNPVKF